MTMEDQFAEVVRRVVREELAAAQSGGVQDLELLTADDVAKMLKYPDRHSVYKLKREGRLKSVSLGDKTLRFTHSEVRRFIQECAS